MALRQQAAVAQGECAAALIVLRSLLHWQRGGLLCLQLIRTGHCNGVDTHGVAAVAKRMVFDHHGDTGGLLKQMMHCCHP